MTQSVKTTENSSDPLESWVNRQTLRFARHWLLTVNVLTGIFVGLPYLAPVLMHYGYIAPANLIYHAYRVTCHQLPSRSFSIFEHQMALCHRCNATWLAFLIGGLMFYFLRSKLKPLPFHWWILALIPIGLDGGTQLIGPFYEVLPGWVLTGFAILVWLALTIVLYKGKTSNWQYYLFVLCFPLGMMFVQFTGTRLSNWQLRTITGSIFGLANAWLLFPMLEEAFQETREEMERRLGNV